MAKNLDITGLLGEDVSGPRHSSRAPRRSLSEAARALVGDDRSAWDRWCEEFEQSVAEAMKHPHRTFGSPHRSAGLKGD
jgi:hypothetical protein